MPDTTNQTDINDTLTICHWNCRSINRRIKELPHLIDKNNIDILCLSETFLQPDHNFSYYGYNIISKERNERTASGGVATLIR